jgi:hypothetical protein
MGLGGLFFKANQHDHTFIWKTRVVPLQLGRILKLLPRSRKGTFNLIGTASAKFPLTALENTRLAFRIAILLYIKTLSELQNLRNVLDFQLIHICMSFLLWVFEGHKAC